MQHEATCPSYKKFKSVEGEEQCKQMKERKPLLFYWEDCKHKIRFDAFQNVFSFY
ncbi:MULTISPECIES: hypothetical protein [Lysinibacillus]|uniref:hypothetical protein n=1 Tax=Lysinibacillus TaxID=400634 RepID=UPI00031B6604|nr:hypothetical protein [Lysinibacillus boronitolerans]